MNGELPSQSLFLIYQYQFWYRMRGAWNVKPVLVVAA